MLPAGAGGGVGAVDRPGGTPVAVVPVACAPALPDASCKDQPPHSCTSGLCQCRVSPLQLQHGGSCACAAPSQGACLAACMLDGADASAHRLIKYCL